MNILHMLEKLTFVPRIINTHYWYQTYDNPTTVIPTKNTQKKYIAQSQIPQKKLHCDKDKSETHDAGIQSAHIEKKPNTRKTTRYKSRKSINKRALAKYFDNSLTDSQQWLADVVEEINRNEAEKRTNEYAEHEQIRKFVESLKSAKETVTVHYTVVIVADITPLINALVKALEQPNTEKRSVPERTAISFQEINEDVLDKFECRMQRVSQARGMKKMHDIHKLRQNQK